MLFKIYRKIVILWYNRGMEKLSRTKMLLGQEKLNRLNNSTVAVFGIGGVGGYVLEALARSGVGTLILVDGDVVATSNINRQIIALNSTVGKAKVEVMKERIKDINSDINVITYNMFFEKETMDKIDISKAGYVVDCIDRVTNKVDLIEWAKSQGKKVISAMGAGNKLDATKFEVSDIYKTSVCPLAKIMRKLLKERNIKDLKVVYSKELPIKVDEEYNGKATCGSVAFVPSCMGLIMAGEVIKDL